MLRRFLTIQKKTINLQKRLFPKGTEILGVLSEGNKTLLDHGTTKGMYFLQYITASSEPLVKSVEQNDL